MKLRRKEFKRVRKARWRKRRRHPFMRTLRDMHLAMARSYSRTLDAMIVGLDEGISSVFEPATTLATDSGSAGELRRLGAGRPS